MAAVSHHGARSRGPVHQGQTRIVGLWVRKKADGSIVYETQKRMDGKMCRVVHRDIATKTEAIAAHAKLGVGVEQGEVRVGDRSLTMRALVADFLAREEGILATRKPSTVALYRTRLTTHVLPALGSMKADDLRVQHVRALVDKLKAKGQGGSSIRGCVAALSAALQHGERHLGTPTRNVCRDLGRGELPSNQRQSEPRYLSVAEIESLLATMTDETRPVAATCFWRVPASPRRSRSPGATSTSTARRSSCRGRRRPGVGRDDPAPPRSRS